MPKIKFTVKTIEALLPSEKLTEYWDDGHRGLGLRVSPLGLKSWFFYYRWRTSKRRLSLGTFPVIGLAEARIRANESLYKIQSGIDPSHERLEDRNAPTFSNLVARYLNEHAIPNKKSWKEDRRILYRDVRPCWGSRVAKEITRKEVISLLCEIVNRNAPVHSNRVLTLVRKVFNFGIENEMLDANPCYMVKPRTVEHARDRVLTPDEIHLIWCALGDEDVVIASIFRLMLAGAQRGFESRSIKWVEIDLRGGWWTIPSEKTKNEHSHRVPISPIMYDIFSQVSATRFTSEYIFPSPVDLDIHINNIQKAVERIRKRSGVVFVAHDFRRTASSYMASLKVPRTVISKILNHAEGGVTKIYDRHSYDDEKREALNRWSDFLMNMIQAKSVDVSGRVGALATV